MYNFYNQTVGCLQKNWETRSKLTRSNDRLYFPDFDINIAAIYQCFQMVLSIFNPLPHDNILDIFKLSAVADYKVNASQKL